MRVTCSSSGSRFSMYALRQLVASYFENASAFRHISRKWRSYFSMSGRYAVRARALREASLGTGKKRRVGLVGLLRRLLRALAGAHARPISPLGEHASEEEHVDGR